MGAVSRTEVLLSLVLMVVGVLLASKVAGSVLHPRDEVGDRIKPFSFVVLCVLGEHGGSMVLLQLCRDQGSRYRPVRPNRRGPVPVYRTGLAGNRSKPVEVKFEFKIRCANGSYRYTGRLDRFTGRFDW